MKTHLPLLFLTYTLLLCSCMRSNVLTYKHRKHFKEESIISGDTTFQLVQNVCFNEPGVIDEEYCYSLKLIFPDTSLIRANMTLDLEKDTNLVKARYGVISVWNWNDENNAVSGEIEILSWNSDKVLLNENIVAKDMRREVTKKFKGKRTFFKSDVW